MIHKWREYKKVRCLTEARVSNKTECGKWLWDFDNGVDLASDNWDKVTCPDCLKKK